MLADENNLVEKVLTESRITYPHGMYGDGTKTVEIRWAQKEFDFFVVWSFYAWVI